MSSGFQDEIRNALDVSTETDARREGAELARRPEDADITETVARNSEDAHDDTSANGAGPEVHGDDQRRHNWLGCTCRERTDVGRRRSRTTPTMTGSRATVRPADPRARSAP